MMNDGVARSPALARTTALDPSRRWYRYAVLLLVGLLTCGSYFAYDSIGALGPTLIEAWNVGRADIGVLYTLYSVAAIVSVLIGGVLCDRLGTRIASLIFSGLIVGGAVMVAVAPSLPVAGAGRFVFGAGSESLIVAQSAILARWFRGRELAFAFGFTLTIARVGTLFSFSTKSLLASRFGWGRRPGLRLGPVAGGSHRGFGARRHARGRRPERALGRDASTPGGSVECLQ